MDRRRPRPTRRAGAVVMKRPLRVRIRACRPGDERSLDSVFGAMSSQSRYQRYHAPVPVLPPSLRALLTAIDPPHHVVYAADVRIQRRWHTVGLARYVVEEPGRGEFAIEVADAFQGRGLGTRLLGALRQHAIRDGLRQLHGEVLADNVAALRSVERVFDRLRRTVDGAKIQVICRLPAEDAELTTEDLLVDLVGPRFACA